MSADRLARAAPLLALIRKHESDPAVKGQNVRSAYDVVYGGIREDDRPKRLSAMKVSRVLWWQDLIDPTYPSEAAGAYQIMEDTLRRMVTAGKIDADATFSGATQDACALILLDGRGWARCEAGSLSPSAFADQLAREWASLPVQRAQKGAHRRVKRGQSYYAGDELNKAHATPDAVMAAITASLEEAPASMEDRLAAIEARVAALEASLSRRNGGELEPPPRAT